MASIYPDWNKPSDEYIGAPCNHGLRSDICAGVLVVAQEPSFDAALAGARGGGSCRLNGGAGLCAACRLCNTGPAHRLHACSRNYRLVAGALHFSDDSTFLGIAGSGGARSMGGAFARLLVIIRCDSSHHAGIGRAHREKPLVDRLGEGAMGHYAEPDTSLAGNVSAGIDSIAYRKCPCDSSGEPSGGSAYPAGHAAVARLHVDARTLAAERVHGSHAVDERFA